MKSEIEIKIRGYHADHFKHVNHARYLEFLEEARWNYFEDYNLIEMLFHPKSIFLAVFNIKINYRRSAVAGDTLRIETALNRVEKRKVIFSQKIYSKSSDKMVCDAEITNVLINTENKELIKINQEILEIWPELQKYYDTYK